MKSKKRPFYKILAIAGILLAISQSTNAQLVTDNYKYQRYRETAINITGVLQTLPLFNQITDFRAVEPTMMFKFALNPRRPRAMRFGLGVAIDGEDDSESKFYLSVGTERNRHLFHHFYAMSGFDFVIAVSGANDGGDGFFGGSWPFGLKYDLTKQFSIYTEARLLFGLNVNEGGTVLDLRPPTSIYVAYRFYRQPVKPRYYE